MEELFLVTALPSSSIIFNKLKEASKRQKQKTIMMNEEVCSRIQDATGLCHDLLTKISSGMDSSAGIVNGARRKKRMEYNINEWTGKRFVDSLRAAEDMEEGNTSLQNQLWCTDDRQGWGTEMR